MLGGVWKLDVQTTQTLPYEVTYLQHINNKDEPLWNSDISEIMFQTMLE